MFGNIFSNMPPVVKNILIINVLFFLATAIFKQQGIYLDELLSMHYPTSNLFRPYQLVTSIFMHGDIGHIFFNMFGLVLLGSHLERVWGAKKFFIFYFVTGIGASLCSQFVNGIEIYNEIGTFFPASDIEVEIVERLRGSIRYNTECLSGCGAYDAYEIGIIAKQYISMELGASGALYGILMAFALLFPNTEFFLLFPPIPIKAKWLALILGGISLYSGVAGKADGIGHFAHLGGMLFGFIMIKIWQRNRNEFY